MMIEGDEVMADIKTKERNFITDLLALGKRW
jgi:hypothetical protein